MHAAVTAPVQVGGGPRLLVSRSRTGSGPRLPLFRLRFALTVSPGLPPNTPVKSDMPWRSNARAQPKESDVSPGWPRILCMKPPSVLGVQFTPMLGAMLSQSVLYASWPLPKFL